MLRLLRREERDTAAIEAEMRRFFFARWRSLIDELAAAQGGVGCRGNPVAESIGDPRSDRAGRLTHSIPAAC